MSKEQQPATEGDLRRHMLRQLLPTAYGTEAERKAAQNAEKKATEQTAAQKREKRDADDAFNRQQMKSLAMIGDRTALQAQHQAAREALEAPAAPAPSPFSAEERAAAEAAGVNPAALTPEELAAVVAASKMSK